MVCRAARRSGMNFSGSAKRFDQRRRPALHIKEINQPPIHAILDQLFHRGGAGTDDQRPADIASSIDHDRTKG